MFDAIERYMLHLLARDYRSNEFIVTIIERQKKMRAKTSFYRHLFNTMCGPIYNPVDEKWNSKDKKTHKFTLKAIGR
jgi:hypothetical protein